MKLHRTVFWLILVLVLGLIMPDKAFAYYDPGAQRWINRDPIGDGARLVLQSFGPRWGLLDPVELLQGPNLHAGFLNNPVTQVDPFGLSCGSGWNEPWVPDGDVLGHYDFTDACNAHDNCYTSGKKGGG